MLTPTSPLPLPDVSACQMGRLVTGTTAAQIANATLQATTVKLLGEAHYHLQSPTPGGKTNWLERAPYVSKGYEETWELLYATTPLTKWISVELLYVASVFQDDTPTLQVSVKSFVGGAVDGTIDAGLVLDDFLELRDSATSNPVTIASGWIADRAPSGSASTVPRPLYIPEANRGEIVVIRVASSAVQVLAVHLLDVYQEA